MTEFRIKKGQMKEKSVEATLWSFFYQRRDHQPIITFSYVTAEANYQ